jgi:hypothetical protein
MHFWKKYELKWLNFAIIGTGRAEQVGLAMH